MTSEADAREMLRKALVDERVALAALNRSRRDRERAEEMLQRSHSVTRELRNRRTANHYTETFIELFGGSA